MILFNALIGQKIEAIQGVTLESSCVKVVLENGVTFELRHLQDCCEDVELVDIIGEPQALVGHWVTKAEALEGESVVVGLERQTWTFYEIETANGAHLTLRWLGTSDGEYAEDVDILVDAVPGSPGEEWLYEMGWWQRC